MSYATSYERRIRLHFVAAASDTLEHGASIVAEADDEIAALRARAERAEAERDALRAELGDFIRDHGEAGYVIALRDLLASESESRSMFVSRLENIQEQGDKWAGTVLALLNDCDMLAAIDTARGATPPAASAAKGDA